MLSQLCLTLCSSMDCSPPGSSTHGISQANIGAGCHFLLQRIFPTQRSNPHLLHLLNWRVDFFFFFLPRVSPGKPLYQHSTSKKNSPRHIDILSHKPHTSSQCPEIIIALKSIRLRENDSIISLNSRTKSWASLKAQRVKNQVLIWGR